MALCGLENDNLFCHGMVLFSFALPRRSAVPCCGGGSLWCVRRPHVLFCWEWGDGGCVAPPRRVSGWRSGRHGVRHEEQLLPAIVHSTAPTLIEYCGGPMSKKWGYPASAKKGRKRTAAQVLKGLFFSLLGVSGRGAFGNGAPRVDRLEDYVP